MHPGASGNVNWVVSGGRAICTGVLSQAQAVEVASSGILGHWVMVAGPGTLYQGGGGQLSRGTRLGMLDRAAGPYVQVGQVSR